MTKILTPGGHGIGWRPSLPDHRDYPYTGPAAPITLPASVDLRKNMLHVRDQGQLGSCTSFGATALAYYVYVKDGWHNPFPPSPLFVYYNERVLEDTVDTDSGGDGRTVMQALATSGMTAEKNWAYDIGKFTVKPTQAAYSNAAHHTTHVYMAVPQTLQSLQTCLAEGYPLIVGFSVYESFEDDAVATTGVVPMPGPNEQLLGGHMTCICGYDTATQRFLVQNSWGVAWGMKGYFTIPYQYILDSRLSGDLYTSRVQY